MPGHFKVPKTYTEILNTLPPFIRKFVRLSQRAAATKYEYVIDYRMFLEWMIDAGLSEAKVITDITIGDFEALKPDDIREYIESLKEEHVTHRNIAEGKANYTDKTEKKPNLKRKMASLNALFFELYDVQELLSRNTMVKLKGYLKKEGESESHLTRYLDFEEIDRLFKAVRDSAQLEGLKEPTLTKVRNTLLRNETIITVLLGTGIRVSTLCALDTNDIDFHKCEASVRVKGNKEKTLPIDSKVIEVIQKYLNDPTRRKPHRNDKGEEDPDAKKALFLSERGFRIDKSTVQKMVKGYLNKAGLKDDLSTHSLRHSFGTLHYNSCLDPKATGEALLHEDHGETAAKYYANLRPEKQREIIGNIVNDILSSPSPAIKEAAPAKEDE